jgi:hypothetical protein
MAFAIKTEIDDPRLETFAFTAQKTMYGGKHIAKDDTIFLFASENEGGHGLVSRGFVTSAELLPRKHGIERQTPRVSLTNGNIRHAKRSLGRNDLKHHTDWNYGAPKTELNFKFYSQATNKIIGISDETSAFLAKFF